MKGYKLAYRLFVFISSAILSLRALSLVRQQPEEVSWEYVFIVSKLRKIPG